MMEWLNQNASAVGAIASIINLLLIFVLVGATIYYAKATSKISEDTKRQAEASMRMAEEMEKTRKLTYRPMLDLNCTIPQSSSDLIRSARGADAVLPRDLDISVINVGFSPAFDVRVYIEPSDLGFPSMDIARVDSGPGEIRELKLIANEGIDLNLTKLGLETSLVATYTDLEGRCWKSLRKIVKNGWWEFGH